MTTSAPDIADLEPAEFPRHVMPRVTGQRTDGFTVVMKRSVLNAVQRHCRSAADVEVCGVLVGNVFHDDDDAYLHVQAFVSGENASSRATNVTFTAETWQHIQDVMDRDYPNQRVVGWYHSHPGFGIFLSKMDLFIHEYFFNLPWQVAYVFDPQSREDGVFIWRGGTPSIEQPLIEEDAAEETPAPELAAVSQLARRVRLLERRQKALLVALVLAFLTSLAWPIVLFALLHDAPPTPGQSTAPPRTPSPF